MRGSFSTIARKRPSTNVVATDRNAKTNVQIATATKGPRMDSSVKARTKLSAPTVTTHPGRSSVPSSAVKAPVPVSRYTVPSVVSVIVSAAASQVRLDVNRYAFEPSVVRRNPSLGSSETGTAIAPISA